MQQFWDDLRIIEPEEIPEVQSKWGNSYHIITREQLVALEEGKVICYVDEYGTFIKLENSDESKGTI